MSSILEFPLDLLAQIRNQPTWAVQDLDQKGKLIADAAKAEIDDALALFAAGKINLVDAREFILDYATLIDRGRGQCDHQLRYP